MKNLVLKLSDIQKQLKAPKGQYNSFGGYKYRSCEDILEAVKPLLDGVILTISDEIIEVGGRVYVKATARISDGENTIENSALAREPETKRGFDESQTTGAASSYARKYALNGLLCIDDTKDADSMRPETPKTYAQKTPSEKAAETRAANKASFENRFAKMYEYMKKTPQWGYTFDERFNDVIAEAVKRKYETDKIEEMLKIYESMEKDSMPSITIHNLGEEQ